MKHKEVPYVKEVTSNEDKELVAASGGRRSSVGERWDLIPGAYSSMREVAKVAAYGAKKYEENNWLGLDPTSEQSPLNHAIRHANHALEFPFGSSDRRWQLAKAAWNILAQLWFEREK